MNVKLISKILPFVSLILIYPLFIYFFHYKLGYCPDCPDNLAHTRVFFVGPLLMLNGIFLFSIGGKKIQKTLGIFSVFIGIVWICIMLSELFSKP
jgi:hypothetical protein